MLSDDQRNLFIAGFSQMFIACTNIFTPRIAMLFEAKPNMIGPTTVTAMQYLGLILMMAVFTWGYIHGKREQAK